MSYGDAVILKDVDGNPIPQSYNVATKKFEVLKETVFVNSTDTKPLGVDKGDTLFEIDTSKVFVYSGTEWVEI